MLSISMASQEPVPIEAPQREKRRGGGGAQESIVARGTQLKRSGDPRHQEPSSPLRLFTSRTQAPDATPINTRNGQNAMRLESFFGG